MPERSEGGSAPTLKKIDVTIARLRLLLADVSAREASLVQQRHVFDEQRAKLMAFAIYGDSTLDSVLAMLADVDERIADVDSTARRLAALRSRATQELESLQLTKGTEEARTLLAHFKAQQQRWERADAGEPTTQLSREELEVEINRLTAQIAEASERAARSLEQQAQARHQ